MTTLALYTACAFGICAFGAWVCQLLDEADRKRQERARRFRARLKAWEAVRNLDNDRKGAS